MPCEPKSKARTVDNLDWQARKWDNWPYELGCGLDLLVGSQVRTHEPDLPSNREEEKDEGHPIT